MRMTFNIIDICYMDKNERGDIKSIIMKRLNYSCVLIDLGEK